MWMRNAIFFTFVSKLNPKIALLTAGMLRLYCVLMPHGSNRTTPTHLYKTSAMTRSHKSRQGLIYRFLYLFHSKIIKAINPLSVRGEWWVLFSGEQCRK